MKSIALIPILCFILISLVSPARAEMALGYETLTVLPHAFTLHNWDNGSGWGYKASAGFGMSTIAISASYANAFFSFGTPDDIYIFSLYFTKNTDQKDNYRSFFKFGGWLLNANFLGENETVFIPSLGYGWEWRRLWESNWAFGVDAAYPELFNLGMRYYL